MIQLQMGFVVAKGLLGQSVPDRLTTCVFGCRFVLGLNLIHLIALIIHILALRLADEMETQTQHTHA